MHKKLIYISSLGPSVIESQVLSYIEYVGRQDVFDELYLIVGKDKKDVIKKHENALSQSKVKTIQFWDLPAYNVFKNLQYKMLCNVLDEIDIQDSIIHMRGYQYTYMIHKCIANNKIKDVKTIADMRGAVLEEALYHQRYSAVKKHLKRKYHCSFRKSLLINTDYVSVVSDELKRYVCKYYRIPESRIEVCHSMAGQAFKYSEEDRKKIRTILKVNDHEVLFIFSTAGNAMWQNTKAIIEKISMMGYKIVNMSKNSYIGENVINLYVQYKDVPSYLSAADIGIIIRNNDIVNNVASPVKFSEYVCCGLPVISNNSVRLISDYTKETNNGVVVDTLDDINEETISQLLTLDRNKISSYGLSKYHVSSVFRKYISLYGKE